MCTASDIATAEKQAKGHWKVNETKPLAVKEEQHGKESINRKANQCKQITRMMVYNMIREGRCSHCAELPSEMSYKNSVIPSTEPHKDSKFEVNGRLLRK